MKEETRNTLTQIRMEIIHTKNNHKRENYSNTHSSKEETFLKEKLNITPQRNKKRNKISLKAA